MTWLHPWAAWFLAGVPVIVLLYLVRSRRRAVTVSTLMFWQRVLKEGGDSAFLRRLRQPLSLLLHLLIFLLILAALARPVPGPVAAERSATVIILDNRARMQAVEPGGATRFDAALKLARALAGQAAENREVALLTIAGGASIAAPFSTDGKPLLAALDELSPSDASGDLAATAELAASLLAARNGTRRIVLLSERLPAWKPPTGVEFTVHSTGQALDNVAITRLATRALPADPRTSEVLLEIRNFGATSVISDVELAFDGRILDVKPLTLAPGERRLDVFSSVPRPTRSTRGWLAARLTAGGALACDDTAYATLPPPRALRVLLVSKGNPFLEKLLAVDPSVNFQFIEPGAWLPGMGAKFEAVIFDRVLPDAFDFTAAEGNFLFVKSTPFAAGGAEIEQPPVTDADAAHPAIRSADLRNAAILRAARLALPLPRDGWTFEAPLRSFEHPLLVAGRRERRRVAGLAFDLLETDLPFRVAFPLLVTGTLHWLAGEDAAPLPPLAAGEVFTLPDGASASPEPVADPRAEPPGAKITGVFQPMKNGFHRIEDAGGVRWLAVNTFSIDESDLRGAGGAATDAAGAPRLATAGRAPWQWLALAALALLLMEWWLFHRRRTE